MKAVITFILMSLIGALEQKRKISCYFAITNLSYQIINGFYVARNEFLTLSSHEKDSSGGGT